ncbi:MAG TPA: carboxypeptidase-like regulatory domain-containing protein, partial [Mucilaginibacter sp.]|nr:carboxypeptidase-like regulatory domain-containing protein [Mucilaginibacter sp.]
MKKYFIYFLLSLFASAAFGQTLTGTITDAITHEPLAGAIISNDNGIVQKTNAKGRFTIAQGRVNISMIGYISKTISFSGDKAVIELTPSAVDLQPVIVSASREGESRQDAPIAISKINSTVITETKATA